MGTVNHNAIIATTWSDRYFDQLREWIEVFPVSEQQSFMFSGPKMNGYKTVILIPDGSNEGWAGSRDGNILRQQLIDRLAFDNYTDGTSPWDWVEIGYGEYGQTVLRGNNKNRMSDADYHHFEERFRDV